MDRRYKKRIDRYWTTMRKQGLKALGELDMNSWFNFWHTHPDWDGKGNRCTENRASAAVLGYQLLMTAEKLSCHRDADLQCWATFCEDTGNNAIYIHSENPANTPYPYDFPDCQWGASKPDYLSELDFSAHELGRFVYTDEVVYVIRRRN